MKWEDGCTFVGTWRRPHLHVVVLGPVAQSVGRIAGAKDLGVGVLNFGAASCEGIPPVCEKKREAESQLARLL